MHLVDSGKDKTGIENIVPKLERSEPVDDIRTIETAISLMSNVVETACERAPDLDLMRLLNFMDLYRVYLQLASNTASEVSEFVQSISEPSRAVITQKLGDTEFVSFERFVRDSRLLDLAAAAATCETGEVVSPPLPLSISANA